MFEFSKYIFFISLWFITSLGVAQTATHDSLGYSKKDPSESLQNKYKRHVTTLDYISRKTDNNKYFLNLALNYCDSLSKFKEEVFWTTNYKNKIQLTLASSKNSMSHKVQFFNFFKELPTYMGFADTPDTYAYQNALKELYTINSLADENHTSIITRGDCSDVMFEKVYQSVVSNTNHNIITSNQLLKTLGETTTHKILNGELTAESLDLVCKKFNLENLGIFRVTNLDIIEEQIWLVKSEFSTYSSEDGFSELQFSKGFSQDKRGTWRYYILVLLLESILFITLIAVLEEKFIKFIRTKKWYSVKEMFSQFLKKLNYVILCFTLPTLLSFLMIYTLSFLTPSFSDHYMEFNSLFWVIAITLGMSIIPTFINLFIINRLQIDGFHSIRGYRTFANASLYATYIPLFVFYIVQFENYPRTPHFLLLILSFVLGDLMARSYFKYTSKNNHSNQKAQAISGLVIGILALIFFNTYALTEISTTVFLSSLIFVAPLSIIHYQFGKHMDKRNEKKLKFSSEKKLFKDGEIKFIQEVIDPKKDIYDIIDSNLSSKQLNIMLIAAPMGIGKTRSLEEAQAIFKENNWNWYYGDCDEIQGKDAISFEPFIEAFKTILRVNEFTDRSKQMESLSGDAVKVMAGLTGIGTELISDYQRDENRSMTEICVEIAEKLELSSNKTVFVLEDIHWIDPESYIFLKHFIKTVNRNEFIKGNLCVVLTLRNDDHHSYRGKNYRELRNDLNELNNQLETPTKIDDLLKENQFNVNDFINYLSNQNNQFKIQDDSLADINFLLNSAISDSKDGLVITPLYILKLIEQWIQNQLLFYTPDGYVLNRSIDSIELPNTNEINAYYHTILKEFDPKWTRILESATTIGNKFNAKILAQVWNYELLDVLGFLEDAEKKGFIIDIPNEDNMFEFTNKRVVSAIKNYYSDTNDTGVKQIIIEYNKRYLELQKHIIEDPSEYSIEEVLAVVRRLAMMAANPHYNKTAKRLIFEIIVRLLVDEEYDKVAAFSNFLENSKFTTIGKLIILVTKVLNPSTSVKEFKKVSTELYNNIYPETSVEQEFRVYGLMFMRMKSIPKIDLEKKYPIKINELELIKEQIDKTYRGKTLISLSFLYLNATTIQFEEKLLFLENLNSQLKTSSEYKRFNLYVEHLKISLKFANDFDKKEIDQSSKLLLQEVISTKDFRLIKICLKLRIKIVSKFTGNIEDGIEIFKIYDSYLRPKQIINIHWVSFFTSFMNTNSGILYGNKNFEDAKLNLRLCKDFINKRHNSNDWSNLIEDWFNAKKQLFKEAKMLDELKKINKQHMAILMENKLEHTAYFTKAKKWELED